MVFKSSVHFSYENITIAVWLTIEQTRNHMTYVPTFPEMSAGCCRRCHGLLLMLLLLRGDIAVVTASVENTSSRLVLRLEYLQRWQTLEELKTNIYEHMYCLYVVYMSSFWLHVCKLLILLALDIHFQTFSFKVMNKVVFQTTIMNNHCIRRTDISICK